MGFFCAIHWSSENILFIISLSNVFTSHYIYNEDLTWSFNHANTSIQVLQKSFFDKDMICAVCVFVCVFTDPVQVQSCKSISSLSILWSDRPWACWEKRGQSSQNIDVKRVGFISVGWCRWM